MSLHFQPNMRSVDLDNVVAGLDHDGRTVVLRVVSTVCCLTCGNVPKIGTQILAFARNGDEAMLAGGSSGAACAGDIADLINDLAKHPAVSAEKLAQIRKSRHVVTFSFLINTAESHEAIGARVQAELEKIEGWPPARIGTVALDREEARGAWETAARVSRDVQAAMAEADGPETMPS